MPPTAFRYFSACNGITILLLFAGMDTPPDRRIVYRTDADAVLVAEVFGKTTKKTPQEEVELCKQRFAAYDRIKKGETK